MYFRGDASLSSPLPFVLLTTASLLFRVTRIRTVAIVSFAFPRVCGGFVVSRIPSPSIRQRVRGNRQPLPPGSLDEWTRPFHPIARPSIPLAREGMADRSEQMDPVTHLANNATEWFNSLGVLIDPATFRFEPTENEKQNQAGGSEDLTMVYSAEATLAGKFSPSFRIYWTTTQSSTNVDERVDDIPFHSLAAFESPVTDCWKGPSRDIGNAMEHFDSVGVRIDLKAFQLFAEDEDNGMVFYAPGTFAGQSSPPVGIFWTTTQSSEKHSVNDGVCAQLYHSLAAFESPLEHWWIEPMSDYKTAMEWFDSVGVCIDPATFSFGPVESEEQIRVGGEEIRSMSYSAEATLVGNPSVTVFVEWMTEQSSAHNGADDGVDDTLFHSLAAFESPLTKCWIEPMPNDPSSDEYGSLASVPPNLPARKGKADRSEPRYPIPSLANNAKEWFDSAGVLFDLETFRQEEGQKDEIKVYSAEATLAGKSYPPVRIYWTMTRSHAGDDKRFVQTGGTSPLVECWIHPQHNNDDGDNKWFVHTPGHLATLLTSIASTSNEPLLVPYPVGDPTDDNGKFKLWCINPSAIDAASLRKRSFYQWDGSVLDVFCATQRESSETFWWQTRPPDSVDNRVEKNAVSEDPYGEVYWIENDEQWDEFRRFSGGERGTIVLRDTAMRSLALSQAFSRKSSGTGWAFLGEQQQQQTSAARRTAASLRRGILAFACTWASVSVLRSFLTGPNQLVAMAQKLLYGAKSTCDWNGPFLRSLPKVFIFYAAVVLLLRRKHLRFDSPLVNLCTTLTVFVSCISGPLVAIADYAVLVLVKVPMVAALRTLSLIATNMGKGLLPRAAASAGESLTRAAECIRRKPISKASIFNFDRRGSPKRSRRVAFFGTVVAGPLREELVFRWGFEKVWRVAGALLPSSPPTTSSSWVLPSCLLFGAMHASNWLPVRREHVYAFGSDEPLSKNATTNIAAALLTSTWAFFTSFTLLAPLYLQKGLFASFGAHAAINFIGFVMLISSS